MNKKQLLIATVVAMLSVTTAGAATDITGVTSNNGIFNIDPSKTNGDVGYRQYDNFNLDKGDIANLIFKKGDKNLETFINLVNSGVNINGVLNTMRDGNFYNGHAVFITPGGMTIGASGVLNVGTLSVTTPTQDAYNTLKSEYTAGNYNNINNISNLLNNETNAGKINVQGKVFTRNGVQLRGSDITVAQTGAIVNGVQSTQAFTDTATAATQAEALFNSLVNTQGIVKDAQFVTNGSNIQIKSAGAMNIAGTVVNGAAKAGQANSGLYLTSNNGTSISGLVQSTNELNVYNKVGDLSIDGTVKNANSTLNISNKGTDLNINSTAKLSTDKDLAIVNNGTGDLDIAGSAVSKGKTDIINGTTGKAFNISGNIGDDSTTQVRIVNRGGQLAFTGGNVKANGLVRVENTGAGMNLAGNIKSAQRVSIDNRKGDLTVNGKVEVTKGDLAIWNKGTANKLTLGDKADIVNHGNIAIKNEGAGGAVIGGKITNEGQTAINNTNGALAVNGTINNTGNMGIINKDKGTGLTIADTAVITNTGDLKVVNSKGANGTTIAGNITNTGNTEVYNDAGRLKVDGTVANSDGHLYFAARNDGADKTATGITTGANSHITNSNGDIVISSKGADADGNGLTLAGEVKNTGKGVTAINNYNGKMAVGGTVTAGGDLGVINRAGGSSMDVNATLNTANANIKNYGTGDMNVAGTITHTGRVNVLANTGKLTLSGKVHNNSNGSLDNNNGFYAAARAQGTGLNVTQEFVADGNGQYLIKNISGGQGMNYEGKIDSAAQAELYNKAGDMNVAGTVKGEQAIILNTGKNLNTTGAIQSGTAVKVVHKGTGTADVSKATVTAPNEKWFWNKQVK